MMTRRSLASAESTCKRWNRHAVRAVIVEGPNDDEWTVMDIRDATDAGFLYSWIA